ncbi:MAG: hypothetical protein V3T05_03885 [Myxococcota bacterium]
MERLLIWPENPAASLLVLFIISQVFFWAARHPVHQALRAIGSSLAGSFRLGARWLRGVGVDLEKRNREVLIEAARTETEKKIEREFVRLQAGFARELKGYPELHRKLDECVSKLETGYEASAVSPPEVPGWPEAVTALTNVPDMGDRAGNRILNEIRKTAVDSEKKALKEYRESTSKQHKILHGMAPVLKDVRGTVSQTLKSVNQALGAASKIDGHIDRYEKIRQNDSTTERLLASSALSLFIVSTIAVGIAVGGAFVNFQLIALPMSELVPAGSRVLGIPMPAIAALVIVLMEIMAGLFVMEALGVTELFPRIGRLETGKRRMILAVALTGLFLFAGIEASLAILREQIVEAEILLKTSLAASGTDAVVMQPMTSMIPVIGQAVLGFILPWILAMVALPLETMVHSGRNVVGRLTVFGYSGASILVRVLGNVFRQLGTALAAIFDIYIVIPLMIERLVRRTPEPTEKPTRPISARSTTFTGEHEVVS